MNATTLTARIAQPPVYRKLPGADGRHVTELRLAVRGMGSGDRDQVGYIDVVSYTMSEKAATTIDTGWLVAITGRLEHQSWQTDTGEKRSKHRIVATNVEFLAAPRKNGEHGQDSDVQAAVADGDDIPF